MITISVGMYILSTILKLMVLKETHNNISDLILSSLTLNFRKDSSEVILSFPQLIGLIGIFIGLIELVFQKYISNLPSLLLYFLEAVIFLILLTTIIRLIRKQ